MRTVCSGSGWKKHSREHSQARKYGHVLIRGIPESQLKIGTKVEMEHTTNKDLARKIALDHLNENPYYYNYLSKAERQMRQDKKKGCYLV